MLNSLGSKILSEIFLQALIATEFILYQSDNTYPDHSIVISLIKYSLKRCYAEFSKKKDLKGILQFSETPSL